jgi:uncharacterized protein YdhG (YjbR/CyaY superfamily)
MEKTTPRDVDAYIAGFPQDVRTMLDQVRAAIRSAAPDATETIKYGIPTFVQNENLVHFAAFKRHIGFYPSSSGVAAFASALSEYKSAKGSVQFPFDKPMPLKLIAKIVQSRLREVQAKAQAQGFNQ